MQRFDSPVDLDEKSSKKIEWEKIIFDHVQLTSRLMTFSDPNFPRAVETLRSLLIFYWRNNEKFIANIDFIFKNAFEEAQKRRNQSGKIPGEIVDDVVWRRSKYIFEECLSMIGIAGLLPEQTAAWDDK